MTPSVSYDEYTARGGKLAKEAFGASLASAVASVREVMGLNEPDGERQATAYVGAVCAAVDVDAAYGASGGIGENVASVAVGAFSATLAAGTAGVSAYDLSLIHICAARAEGAVLPQDRGADGQRLLRGVQP